METSNIETKSKEIYTEVHDRDEFLAILKENPGITVFKSWFELSHAIIGFI